MRPTKRIVYTLLKFWEYPKAITFFKKKQLVFITGMGRSGTTFLSKLLDKKQDSMAVHELFHEDHNAIFHAHYSTRKALNYIYIRLLLMYHYFKQHNKTTFIEVNSALRFHVKAIKKVFPNALVLFIVRDGREVVRSLYPRGHYRTGAVGHYALQPLPTDEVFAKWQSMSRLQKLAWLWKDANRQAQFADGVILFEKLLTDYDYFNQKLAIPLGIDFSLHEWRESFQEKENKTQTHELPHWNEWNEQQKYEFDQIAYSEMLKYSYY